LNKKLEGKEIELAQIERKARKTKIPTEEIKIAIEKGRGYVLQEGTKRQTLTLALNRTFPERTVKVITLKNNCYAVVPFDFE